MVKIMIASPINQKPEILKVFLTSLKELKTENIKLYFSFIDDNENEDSKKILQDFKNNAKNVLIKSSNTLIELNHRYICDEFTHRWDNILVDKLIYLKNKLIDIFLQSDCDYIFFIDSDILLHPYTLENLVSKDKDILSNIFWTKWNPNGKKLPQVWLKDAYTLYDADASIPLTELEANKKTDEFINMLKKPGVYKVGGLGACTLIKRKPLEAGVNFSKIYNISFWGEDRHFCLRASVLGFSMFVDTFYPAYHIYRITDLDGVSEYKNNCKKTIFNIETFNILKYVENIILPIETYDYRKIDNVLDTNNLTFDFNDNFIQEKKNGQNLNFVSIPKIENFKIDFFNDGSLSIATFLIYYTGYKNNFSFNRCYEKKLVCRKIDKSYIIDAYVTVKKLNIKNINIIRKINLDPKLTLSMVVKNEENRYLEKALLSHREYIDTAVIIDDNSTDRTCEIVKDILGNKNLTLIKNDISLFSNEINLRKLQWKETIKSQTDWILNLDADEIFEDKFKDEVRSLIENIDADGYLFRLYDFWNDDYYRDDALWRAHTTYRSFLIRHQRNYIYQWMQTKQHCGRFPFNAANLNCKISNLRLKHYGWARECDRIKKYERYLNLDPNGEFGNINQYKSILDLNPSLSKWIE